jgi:hypothetical protein
MIILISWRLLSSVMWCYVDGRVLPIFRRNCCPQALEGDAQAGTVGPGLWSN